MAVQAITQTPQPGIDHGIEAGLIEKSGPDAPLAVATRAVLGGDRFRSQLAAARADKPR